MITDAKFLFTICQAGAEAALKAEIARQWPAFRFAFSRPGFVTFKLPDGFRLAIDFDLQSTFARTYGFSLGKVSGSNAQELAQQAWKLAEQQRPHHVHAWQRDSTMPGENGFEPGTTPLANEIGQLFVDARPSYLDAPLPINQIASPGQIVLDCALVQPNEWWIGFHQATVVPQRWPGGVPLVPRKPSAVSRAYLKMMEALQWSQMPVRRGDKCVEIGSAPGGSAAALLELGLTVLGVDPAEMDEEIASHPNFIHLRKRAADMKRREFRDVKWLFADPNIAPQEMLDNVEEIVTHREVHVRGLLLTVKLSDWEIAERIPEFLERIRSWGYSEVTSRQLAFNRQEVCVAARGPGRKSA
jgi:23S rRNA (cytidine2498-2'-O)-methyltransferase